MQGSVANHRRVLLVEFLARGRFFAGVFFPFAKGALLGRDAAVDWVRVLVPSSIMLEPDAGSLQAVADRLLPHLGRLPDCVIFSHCFGERPSQAFSSSSDEGDMTL